MNPEKEAQSKNSVIGRPPAGHRDVISEPSTLSCMKEKEVII